MRDEDVLRLQVAMYDSLIMCRGQSVRDLQRVFDRFALRQRSPAHSFAQRLAFEQF